MPAVVRYLNNIGHGITMQEGYDQFNYFSNYQEITTFSTVTYVYTNKFYNSIGITKVVQILDRAADDVSIKFYAGEIAVISAKGTMSDIGGWRTDPIEMLMDLMAPWEEDYILRGTNFSDEMVGSYGEGVVIEGLGGDDTIRAVNNWQDDPNILKGGAGNDWLHGGYGGDRLFGGIGADNLNGYEGQDRLSGEAGNDKLIGLDGDDSLFGGFGGDSLDGGSGQDRLFGGAGSDELRGGAEADTMQGGGGNDSFIFLRNDLSFMDRDIILDFQIGIDTLEFSGAIRNQHISAERLGGGTLITVELPDFTSGEIFLRGVKYRDFIDSDSILFS